MHTDPDTRGGIVAAAGIAAVFAASLMALCVFGVLTYGAIATVLTALAAILDG